MVMPVSAPQPGASGRAASNAARVRQRCPFSGWAGSHPVARRIPDPDSATTKPCPPARTRSLNTAMVMSAWPSRTGCTSAAPYAADSARSASRKSRCRGTGRSLVALQQPDRLGAGFHRRALAAGAPVPQDYRSRIFRNETRVVAGTVVHDHDHVGSGHAGGRFHGRLDAVGLVTGWNDDGDVTARWHPPILVGDEPGKRGVAYWPGTAAPSPVTVNTDSSPVTWRILRTAGRGPLELDVPAVLAGHPLGGEQHVHAGGVAEVHPGHVHHELHRVVHVQRGSQLALQARGGVKVDLSGQGYNDAITLAASRYL